MPHTTKDVFAGVPSLAGLVGLHAQFLSPRPICATLSFREGAKGSLLRKITIMLLIG